MPKENYKITIQLVGPEANEESIDMKDFADQIIAFYRTLIEIDKDISDQKTVEYRIVDITHTSPYSVTVDQIRINRDFDNRKKIKNSLPDYIKSIKSKKPLPEGWNPNVLEKIKTLIQPIGSKFSRVAVIVDEKTHEIDKTVIDNFNKIYLQEFVEHGEITGALELLNIHDPKETKCIIYSAVDPKKVNGIFRGDMFDELLKAFGKFVTVTGKLKYKSYSNHPYEIVIDELEVHPDEKEIPRLSSLYGAFPNATGDKSTDEFLDEIRDEWDE